MRQKIMRRLDAVLGYALLVRGDDRALLSALRSYAAEMSEDDLRRFTKHYTPPQRGDDMATIKDQGLAAKAAAFRTDSRHCCADCCCCCNEAVLAAAAVINAHCCACCETDCSPEDHKAAIAEARQHLRDALACLDAFEAAVP
jgi:hypothetical protein